MFRRCSWLGLINTDHWILSTDRLQVKNGRKPDSKCRNSSLPQLSAGSRPGARALPGLPARGRVCSSRREGGDIGWLVRMVCVTNTKYSCLSKGDRTLFRERDIQFKFTVVSRVFSGCSWAPRGLSPPGPFAGLLENQTQGVSQF